MTGWVAGRAAAGDTSLAYESLGDPDAPVVLLIASLGRQSVQWRDDACARLAAGDAHGPRRVVRFDHRDTGHSTWRSPRPWVGYTRARLAADVVSILDALAVPRAHLVGRSMGGVVAQTVAIRHPGRVASLTSVFALAGQGPELRRDRLREVIARTTEVPPRPAEWVEEQLRIQVGAAGHRHPADPDEERARLEAEATRAFHADGALAHRMACLDTPSLRDELHRIAAPTLVVQGTADPIVPVEHGLVLTSAVDGSSLLLLEGLGHHLPDAVWDDLAPVLLAHTRPRSTASGGDHYTDRTV